MGVQLQKETNLYDTDAIADGIAGAISAYDASQDQTAIFNKLTDNGVIRGIFMQDGQLYINMDYLQTGTLKLGGVNNTNGIMLVYDASGEEIGRWDRYGINVIYQKYRTAESRISMTMGATSYIDDQGISVDVSGVIVKEGEGTTTSYTKVHGSHSENTIIHSVSNNSIIRLKPGIVIRSIAGKGLKYYDNTYDVYYTECVSKYGFYQRFTNSNNSINVAVGVDNDGDSGIYVNSYSTDAATRSPLLTFMKEHFILELGEANNDSMGSKISIKYTSRATGWQVKSSTQNGSIAVQSSSSRRYKHDISERISEKLDAHRLYDLKFKQFIYNDNHPLQYYDMESQVIPGFIAEDVERIYPAAVIHDGDGKIESWDERRIIPGMLKLIQEQHEEIEKLKSVIHIS